MYFLYNLSLVWMDLIRPLVIQGLMIQVIQDFIEEENFGGKIVVCSNSRMELYLEMASTNIYDQKVTP